MDLALLRLAIAVAVAAACSIEYRRNTTKAGGTEVGK